MALTLGGPEQDRELWESLRECNMKGLGVETEILDEESLTLSYEKVIVTSGEFITRFAQNKLVDSSCKKIALFYETINDGCKKPPSVLYKLTDNILLYTANNTMDMRMANTVFTKFIPWVEKCSDVIVLTSLHISKFGNPDNLEPPVLRYLRTDTFKGQLFAPKLETFDFITGFPASVVSYCQVLNYSAVIYICYTGSYYNDVISCFSELFKSLGMQELIKSKSALSDTDPSYFVNSSNMYL